jgi:hypothetical protein
MAWQKWSFRGGQDWEGIVGLAMVEGVLCRYALARAHQTITCLVSMARAGWGNPAPSFRQPRLITSAPRPLPCSPGWPQSLWGDPENALVGPTFSVAGVVSLE